MWNTKRYHRVPSDDFLEDALHVRERIAVIEIGKAR